MPMPLPPLQRMKLRYLFFILLVTNVPGEGTSTERRISLASGKSQRFGLSNAVFNTQIFTMFRYEGTQVYVHKAMSNDDRANVNSPEKWIFYYVPVVMAALGKDLNGNLSNAWIVGNDVHVNILLGSPEVDELARKAVMKKFKPDVAEYVKNSDVAPLPIDSLTAYIVKESSDPVEGVHPFNIYRKELIIQAHFSCSTREKAVTVLNNILDGIYKVEVAFFFTGTGQVSTNSVLITGTQLMDVFSEVVADGGNTKTLYIHRGQFSKFVNQCITNDNFKVHTGDKTTKHQDHQADLIKQFVSILQQGMASSALITLDAKHWDQVWSPADLIPDKITREMNNIFIYNEDETKEHNFSDFYFDQRKDLSSRGTSGERQEETLAGRPIVSLTEINRDLSRKKHLQLEWTGEKLIPKSFSVIRLSDLKESLQVQLSKKNLEAEKARGAIVHTLKGLQRTNTEDSMAEINKFKSIFGKNYVDMETCKHESKAEVDELKKEVDYAKNLQNDFIHLIKQLNISLQENTENSQGYIGCFKDTSFSRDLNGRHHDRISTHGLCRIFCRNFDYMGLQSGNWCFCGNSYGKYGIAPPADCAAACVGNPKQICGGAYRNSVFKVEY